MDGLSRSLFSWPADRAILLRELGSQPTKAAYLSSSAFTQKGRDALSRRDYAAALADFNRAIALNPEYTIAIAHRGETYRLMEQYEAALADFDRAIELDSDHAWAIAHRGVTYLEMGKYEAALADFDRAVELDPDLAWAIARRGLTYRLMEQYEEALADFSRAIELEVEPISAAYADRGETYRLMERYDEALVDFDRAVELEPDKDWYLYDRALTYRAIGRTDRAQADLSAAIRRAREKCEGEPQDWGNTLNLALYHLAAEEGEAAGRLYREALEAGAPLRFIREALHDLDDLLALSPDHSQAKAMRDLLQEYLQETER